MLLRTKGGWKVQKLFKAIGVVLITVMISAVLASCSSTSKTASSTTEVAHPTITIVAQDVPPVGVILTFDGRSLYHFLKDGPNQSNCVGECLKIWPPLLVSRDEIIKGNSLIKGVFGVIKTSAGYQVTYNEQPLYFYSGDTKPGQVNGQGFKGLWYAVTPNSMAAGSTSTSSSSSTSTPGGY